MQTNRVADKYSPLYFLASVGAGGLSVSFFMYLLFWVPHKGTPVATFNHIAAYWPNASMSAKGAIALAMTAIAVFAFLNLQKLAWNISAFNRWKQTDAYQTLRNSNAETTLLAYPLALAMTVNGLFIVGLVFVPGLWNVVEYLFPVAMFTFALIGMFALSIIGDFLGRVLTKGGVFDVTAHNSFAQMLPTFALAMVSVGFAAPAAMSSVPVTVGFSLVGSTFFGTAAVIYAALALFTAFNSMLHYGTAKEAAPTLMIVVPLMTILGIMSLRQDHGLHATFNAHGAPVETMMFLAKLISVQVVFLLLGMTVLSRQGYFRQFVLGNDTSPGSYGLICPGVAFSVLLQFFVNKGLVAAGLVDKFSIAYWAITAIALASQFLMVWLILRLNKQHFSKVETAAVPAE